MRIFSGSQRHQRAFTLVEVLVVMLIIGLSLRVLFRLDYSTGPRDLENAAREFAGYSALALEEAVLDGNAWGIDFFIDDGPVYGYRWLQFRDGSWQPALPAGMDDFPASVLLDEAFYLDLEVEGLSVQPEHRITLDEPDRVPADFAPEVWFYPDHESTAFSAVFSHAEYGSHVVQSDILGRFRLQEPAP